MPEPLLVADQTVGQIGLILPRLIEESVAADDAAVDLVQPELAPELYRVARLMALDDLGMRLEQAQQLLPGRHRLAVQHPSRRLVDRLADQGQEVSELLLQPLCTALGLLREDGPHPRGLATTLLCNSAQTPIRALHLLGGLFAFAARPPMHLLRQ